MSVHTLNCGSVTAGFGTEVWEVSVVYQVRRRERNISVSQQCLSVGSPNDLTGCMLLVVVLDLLDF